MRSRAFLAALAVTTAPCLIAASGPSPEVPLDKALTIPAAELAATCSRAAVASKYVKLARAGATVYIGRRQVNARNADTVAAEIAAQLEVCRQAVEQRGVADIAGLWVGSASGCERAGSMLGQAVTEPGTTVRFERDGAALTMTVSGKAEDGSEYSFPSPGTVVEHYVTLRDPFNSDYVLQGEATDASIVLRPDAKATLATWPGWANPPKPADLADCVISLRRPPDSKPASGE